LVPVEGNHLTPETSELVWYRRWSDEITIRSRPGWLDPHFSREFTSSGIFISVVFCIFI
jgi:hypothetical protein